MKVACIGNMNNNFFSLTRFLRDRGLDVHLLLFNNEIAHFHPATDTFDCDYLFYTRHLDWGDLSKFASKQPNEIREDLAEFDVLIGCGAAPAYVHKAGRQLDVFVPYGSDLYDLPVYRYKTYVVGFRNFWANLKWQIESMRLARMQREGIVETRYALNPGAQMGNVCNKYYTKFKFKGRFFSCPIPMVYTSVFNPKRIMEFASSSPAVLRMKRIRERHDVVVFHHSRHVWKNHSDKYSLKGNDILIRGFADFVRQNKARNPCLVMFEYGVDVEATKQLISELSIESHVYWFNRMGRKDLMMCLSLADISAGAFDLDFYVNGVVSESLAMARPFIGNRKDEVYSSLPDQLYPMINAKTSSDISQALLDFVERPNHYRDIGEQGRRWLQNNAINRSVDIFVDMIKNCAKGRAN